MKHWLLKSEPEAYSWQDLEHDRTTAWTGVRNFQARNNLRAMAVGDLCLFYHSGKERQIIGIAKVSKTAYPDNTEPGENWSAVDITWQSKLTHPVTLETIKSIADLQNMLLVRHSRLSVSPVTEDEYKILIDLSA